MQTEVLLVTISQNNYAAISFLEEKIECSGFLSLNYPSYSERIPFVSPAAHFRHLFYFPLVFAFHLFKTPKYTWRFFDLILYSCGLVPTYKRILRKINPRVVVFSNDHSIHCRAFHKAADQLGLKTVYLQHAQVIPEFPPLDFDLSLLEGQKTLDQYEKAGPISGTVKLIGMPKFDPYASKEQKITKITKVGICLSKQDDLDFVESTLDRLVTTFPEIKFIVRLHPRDTRKFEKPDLVTNADPSLSIFEFLSDVHFLIAGNSSVHLEAALLGISSVYFEFIDDGNVTDSYGYVQDGLIDSVETYEELELFLRRMIDKPQNNRYDLINYYNSAYRTAYFGNSAELAASFIKDQLMSSES